MRSFIASLLVILSTVDASAQGTELRPGAKIRFEAQGIVAGRLTATLLARTADSITVGSPDAAPLTVALADISGLELSRGKSHLRGAGKGSLIGAAISGGLGLLTMQTITTCTGSTTLGTRRCDSASTTTSDKEAYVGVMVIGGALYGVAIGAAFGSEVWDRFDLPVKPGVQLRAGRPSLSFTHSF